MSMALWVHTLEGRKLTSHQDDHIVMQKFSSEIDAICTRINVSPLSAGIPPDRMAGLIAELDSCIAKLTGPASHDGRFHLALIM